MNKLRAATIITGMGLKLGGGGSEKHASTYGSHFAPIETIVHMKSHMEERMQRVMDQKLTEEEKKTENPNLAMMKKDLKQLIEGDLPESAWQMYVAVFTHHQLDVVKWSS